MSVKLMQNLVKDLETELDFKLDKTQITNCITEIPQDIKLELNDGVLTLKAGSKVYVPNGPGVFDEVVVSTDITTTFFVNGDGLVFYNRTTNNFTIYGTNRIYSGTTAPTGVLSGNNLWYDTTNNKIKQTVDGGTSWSDIDISLPISTTTGDLTKLTSIDQVFNGFGYIGSTTFALPGIKFLTPYGRNTDGSLNSVERITETVILNTYGYQTHSQQWFISHNGQFRNARYYIQDDEPELYAASVWYNTAQNKLYWCRTIEEGWVYATAVTIAANNISTDSNFNITSIEFTKPISIPNTSSLSQDFNQPSVYSIPSTKAVDETAAAIQIADRIYQGVDLTKKFSSEISHYSDVWTWIQARIKAGNFKGIHVGDYIPFQTTAGTVSTNSITALTYNAQIAGIDTYYGYGDTAIAHHIDFITKEVVPVEIKWNPTDNNNGTSTEQHPWLSSAAYAWLNGVNNYSTSAYNNVAHGLSNEGKGMISRLPTSLQNVIITKRQLLEKRYSASGLLTSSNGWDWCNMGKLWLPHEIEVYGCQVWSAAFPDTSVQAWASMGAVQYPLFACTGGKSHNRIKPLAGQSGSRSVWWLSAVRGGASTDVCDVGSNGYADSNVATQAGSRVPLCFRIA